MAKFPYTTEPAGQTYFSKAKPSEFPAKIRQSKTLLYSYRAWMPAKNIKSKITTLDHLQLREPEVPFRLLLGEASWLQFTFRFFRLLLGESLGVEDNRQRRYR